MTSPTTPNRSTDRQSPTTPTTPARRRVLDGLNAEQKEAVTAPDGPVLVLAGAGSGKTRVIVHRIAYLIRERGVAPSSILAVTFTNKAADEMRRRVGEVLGAPERGVWLHTFHALCLRLHRRFGEDVGLPTGFTVLGEDERRALIRALLKEAKLSEREFPVPRLASGLSRLKHRALSAARWGNPAPESDRSWDPFHAALTALAERYQAELDRQKACDFDDLLLKGVELFECSERARNFAASHFQHVLVDEYQDTNRVQYRLLRLLAPHHNLFVVGDEDQSIYNFRGADLRNILDFERDFDDARVVKLQINYRSTGAILRAASSVIRRNEDRKGKKLIPHLDEGERPVIHQAHDERAEAAFTATRLHALRADAARLSNPVPSAAILLRTHAQTRAFEEELVARNIPHQVVGGLRFYERREIKDVLAYARLLVNPDDDASFLRAVNTPQRGVGTQSLAAIQEHARATGGSLVASARVVVDERTLSARASSGLAGFLALLDDLRAQADSLPPSRLLTTVAAHSGLLAAIERENEKSRQDRKENLEQLVAAAAEYEAGAMSDSPSLPDFIDRVSLLSDGDAVAEGGPCLLMTLHAAKGLEFDVVFLAGLEEGLFPHIRATGDRKAVEEERRLFYVGMTRAKRRLYLTWARSRRFSYLPTDRSPSRFLRELGEELGVSSELGSTRAPGGGGTGSAERTQRAKRPRLRTGALVRHPTFGEGRVVDTSGSGSDRRLTVVFPKAGRKRLVEKYASLEVVR